MEGKFTLKIAPGAKALLISFVGMTSVEVPVTSATNYVIKMKSESVSVDEVIVTAMGIKRAEKSLGYSAAKV